MLPLSYSPETADPRDTLPRTVRVLEEGLGRIHTGVQVFVWLDGRTIADFGLGETRPGIPMTTETIVPWLSAGKPVTSAAILSLWEQGRVDLDARVGVSIPEFAANGKQEITVHQLLTHTAGFRQVDIGWPETTWDEALARVCAAEMLPDWIDGRSAAYHLADSWLVLGETLSRSIGVPFVEAVRATVFEPLEMLDSWCGIPEQVWSTNQDRIGGLYQREKSGLNLLEWHTQPWCTAPSPGGNCRGPMRELARLYRAFLGDETIPSFLQPATVDAMTSRQRIGLFDQTLQHAVDFGLGVIVDSKQYGTDTVPYGFGKASSGRAFGHGGSQCSMAFADAEYRLVVAWAANGRPGEPQHQRRNRAINEAIYADVLGLE